MVAVCSAGFVACYVEVFFGYVARVVGIVLDGFVPEFFVLVGFVGFVGVGVCVVDVVVFVGCAGCVSDVEVFSWVGEVVGVVAVGEGVCLARFVFGGFGGFGGFVEFVGCGVGVAVVGWCEFVTGFLFECWV